MRPQDRRIELGIGGEIHLDDGVDARLVGQVHHGRGDVLANVEGEDTKGWTVDQAMRKLRGPKGTEVGVGVRRRGYSELIKFALTRDEVYIPTVPAYFMIDDTTGYIRMQDFGENTDRDVKHALRDLASKGMKRLLYDIRANPGGPLTQVVRWM